MTDKRLNKQLPNERGHLNFPAKGMGRMHKELKRNADVWYERGKRKAAGYFKTLYEVTQKTSIHHF